MELTGGLNDRRREYNGNTQVFEAATAGATGGMESAGGCEGQCWLCFAGGVSDLALWSEVLAEDTVWGVIRI